MKKRVLVFGEYGVLNGGEQSFLAIAPSLQNAGFELVACVPAETDFDSALARLNIANLGLELHDAQGQRKSQAEIRQAVEAAILKASPDLIHCNSLSTSRLIGPVASGLGIPAVGYLRDILKLSNKAIEDINTLSRIIAVSDATRDWHVSRGLDIDKTTVIYNGVDHKEFHPNYDTAPIDDEFGLNADDRFLLYVGQIGMRKGIDTLIEGFQEILKKEKAYLFIVGSRQSQKQEAIDYENQARLVTDGINQSDQTVFWLGRRSDVARLMNRATLLVHAANQEPLGRVLLESAACGLPFVATRVGGTPEIAKGLEPYDLLFEPKSATGLADRVVRLMGNLKQLDELSKAVSEIAATRFSLEQCANRLTNVYNETLEFRRQS